MSCMLINDDLLLLSLKLYCIHLPNSHKVEAVYGELLEMLYISSLSKWLNLSQ